MNSLGKYSNSQEKYESIATDPAAVTGALGRSVVHSMDTVVTAQQRGAEEGRGQEEWRHREPELSDGGGRQMASLSIGDRLESQQEGLVEDVGRNEDEEPYQRSSLYQESSTGPARDSIDGRPDQQMFRHDSNDPSGEMLQQPPAMYIEAGSAPRQGERPRYLNDESLRSLEDAARGDYSGPAEEYADSGPSNDNNGMPGAGAAGLVPDGWRRLKAPAGQQYHHSRSLSGGSNIYSNGLTYTNTASVPASNHFGSLAVSSAVLEDTDGNNQRTWKLYNELQQLQK